MARLLCALVIALASHGTASAAPVEAPAAPAAPFTWERSTPEEQGVDSKVLVTALRRIREENLDVHSLIVIRNDKMILEAYVHPYDVDSLHNVKSVSKSIISALVGIALREKVLDNLDQKVHEFFPEYFSDGGDPRKKEISLRHLLTMTSGLDLDENGPKMQWVFASKDWIKTAFGMKMAADPGKRFLYSTPLTHTMSGILTETSGTSLFDFAKELLYGPLGIEDVRWSQGPKGYYFGGAELFLKPRDMAKFGLLFLHEGVWKGKQVVPAEWVRESTRNQLGPETCCGRYGYWWWMTGEEDYAAMGWGGQRIGIDPARNLVVVSTAADRWAFDKVFRGFDDYKPAGEPLPPDPEAVEELNKLVRELANPAPSPVPELPDAAAKVSGKRWALEANPQAVQYVTYEFPGGDIARVVLERATDSVTLDIGLDGVYRISDSGSLGRMPGGNRVAQRGRWTDADTFEVDAHEMGNPVLTEMRVAFGEEEIEMSGRVPAIGREFSFKGRPAPAEPTR
jgi:CubicO group peptidase (beta-lactamase class C family)